MIVANACPRCRGALTRVEDIGEQYYSCVHCGHTVYGALPKVAVVLPEAHWQGKEPEDRAIVRRRQIARERARAARRATELV